MNARLFKAKDGPLAPLMDNFIQVVTDHQAEFELTNQDVADITQYGADYHTSLTDLALARSTYHGALASKDAARNALVGKGRSIAHKIYGVQGLPDSLITETGLSPIAPTHTKQKPEAPKDLAATPNAIGTVQLKWDGNGNTRGAHYLVEALIPGEEWKLVATTTKHRITLAGFPPGQPRFFRVSASRNEMTSLPSNLSAIYSGDEAEMRLAA